MPARWPYVRLLYGLSLTAVIRDTLGTSLRLTYCCKVCVGLFRLWSVIYSSTHDVDVVMEVDSEMVPDDLILLSSHSDRSHLNIDFYHRCFEKYELPTVLPRAI